MLFAFSAGMNAQEKSKFDEAARHDVRLLKEVIDFDKNTEEALYYLFLKKHDGLSTPELSDERKDGIAKIIDAKLRATLSNEKIDMLMKKDNALYRQLIVNEKK